jgi:hypothetical protein
LILFSLFLLISVLSHTFIFMVILLLTFMRCLLRYSLSLKTFKLLIVLLIPGLLLSSFWTIPFLFHIPEVRIIDPGVSYLPTLQHLFGFGFDYIIWGRGTGEIGIVFVLFLFSLFLCFKLKEKNEIIKFYFFCLYPFASLNNST